MESQKWPALLRSNILDTMVIKNLKFLEIAENRAKELLAISTFAIPIGIAGIETKTFVLASSVFLISTVSSAIVALISIYPHQTYDKLDKNYHSLMHFSHINQYSEAEYLEIMKHKLNKQDELAEIPIRDLYQISSEIITPKFKWIKISHLTFMIGLILTVFIILIETWIL